MSKANQIVEYIWIGAGGILRSKTKVMDKPVSGLSGLPLWNFDGSSTGQAEGRFSDIILKPARVYPDPFRKNNNLMVLCECFDNSKLTEVNHANSRKELRDAMEGHEHHEMWSGIEQEYVIYDAKTRMPFGWREHQNPGSGPQGPYYCGVGGDKVFGRQMVEEHMELCLQMGVKIGGVNAEVMASQWEFQVGTADPLVVADDLWIARYILERVTEKHHAYINYHPKPHVGDWNGSGGHVNFSTKAMREEGGIKDIKEAIKKLELTHEDDLRAYGEHNDQRLTGRHETQSMNKFSWGVGDRGSSIRINKAVADLGKGYFEDRRPASNLDPYLVLSKIVKSVFK